MYIGYKGKQKMMELESANLLYQQFQLELRTLIDTVTLRGKGRSSRGSIGPGGNPGAGQ